MSKDIRISNALHNVIVVKSNRFYYQMLLQLREEFGQNLIMVVLESLQFGKSRDKEAYWGEKNPDKP